MKVYVLKIAFDPLTEEILYVKEYIDGAKAVLHIDDQEIELDDDISKYIQNDSTIGIT
jgi:hypothetical protein